MRSGSGPGQRLSLERVGRQLMIEAPEPTRERIRYEEFGRRLPRYEGPPVGIEDMTVALVDLLGRRGPVDGK